jgi:hypothetical protein
MNGMPRAHGCAGVACFSFAQLFLDMAQATLSTGSRSHLVHVQLQVLCKIDKIAPHIRVLYRDIPFFLNITPT